MDYQQVLNDFKPEKDYFIGVDSDGCVFDSMEIKHKECFIPNIIKHWELQPVSKYAREAAEFVNLYSQWRGFNRFPALVKVFELLREHPVVQKYGIKIVDDSSLIEFINSGVPLGVPSLKEAYEKTKDPVLGTAIEWSKGVDSSVEDIVRGVICFNDVPKTLAKFKEHADIVVVSSTPHDAIVREWEEHDIAQYTSAIAGQEMGNKKTQLEKTTDGNYDKKRILMIGDAPGDMKSAHAVGARFYPIIPGKEEESWEKLNNQIAAMFLNDQYTQTLEQQLIEEFNENLPSVPPWKIK